MENFFLLWPELCFHKCACQLDSPDDEDVRFERGLGHLTSRNVRGSGGGFCEMSVWPGLSHRDLSASKSIRMCKAT